ncbi:MAG: trypsin-like peptidase domain-containing protein [Lentisphaerae bacterium]|jgi:serine protease Do|nr:trypsin-like peptidase domain-containing protein [Lentisphaerota bacterium]MBT4820220.1 trypsin-like peptidase domain-containing protein [Lentisphaerota bacterium]MBT5612215.1 trypsin-like peptidase domain-containing protein [Lentisphaerota bacterium]MBT7061142.1 trypsin-like peptidase domain-containing protein [Lentisphaerota bacterium]MBT7843471.1 trypsin-like peptidase domain-containing protein [Lentisphaerota bacterium]
MMSRRKTIDPRFPVLATLALLLGAATARGESPRKPEAGHRDGYIDSRQMLQTFSKRLQELHDASRSTKTRTLLRQLSRKRCGIQLPAMTEPTVSPADLYELRKEAVVAVGALYKCGKCSKWHTRVASGFLVTSDGVIITNYHVVDHRETKALGAMTYSGTVYPVEEVLAADRGGDIAVLRLQGTGFPYVSMTEASPVGARVWVISNPNKQLYTFTEGIISARLAQTLKGTETKRLSVTADFAGGSSGAPAFDSHGRVVGMVASTRAAKTNAECKNSYAQMVFRYCIPAELILECFAPQTETPPGARSEP